MLKEIRENKQNKVLREKNETGKNTIAYCDER